VGGVFFACSALTRIPSFPCHPTWLRRDRWQDRRVWAAAPESEIVALSRSGDAITASVAMTLPIYLLYELSIGISWLVFRKRERANADALRDDGVPA